ncbi:hypothetical protein [Xenorhabdus szentirmaii]|uniref:Uncharacterized protein n=2 Tax=Xenorhabdus szentirmaii TaxID=290112 RepID=W1IS50_9GAMM|nr:MULTISPECIES: hypothetical protein [Xenorhabdus]MBD2801944.1 hypothetical protein [Xenorhabdus sp. M]PHM30240.1 hypothetical protein Xsze_04359 [Xenorhabdus szentirmaii DSM 16338]PHM44398.1 hypothetical protein Xszus_04230 [Xenorhabdus szentirmaii]CDL81264.1 conserved hypothetical protein [Xenorhabdus szentirmaii DSM 16338]
MIELLPNYLDFLSFFESEPTYKDESEQCLAYTIFNNGVSLEFSFNVTEGWIQTKISVSNQVVSQYLIEGVKSIHLRHDKKGEYLFIEVLLKDTNTVIEIMWKPSISVQISSLINT